MPDPKTKIDSTPQDGESKRPNNWRDLLLEAKLLGLDDACAAGYAGLKMAELRERMAADPMLERDMLQARMRGMADSVRKMKEASQWQSHLTLMENFWSEEFATSKDGTGAIDMSTVNKFRDVASRLTPEQLLRAAELLELGRVEDNRRKTLLDAPAAEKSALENVALMKLASQGAVSRDAALEQAPSPDGVHCETRPAGAELPDGSRGNTDAPAHS